MARSTEIRPSSDGVTPAGYATGLTFALVVAALYVGGEIFVPLALAILLSFVLATPVGWLRRIGLPKVPAVVFVVFLAFGAVGSFAMVVGGQLTQLAQNLPNYTTNIQNKIRDIKPDAGTNGLLGRILDMASELRKEIIQPSPTAVSNDAAPSPSEEPIGRPIPVEVVNPNLSPREVVTTVLGPIISPLITLGIVIVFVIFILLQQRDLRDRMIRLVSAGDVNRTTQALEDAGSRVANYLLMQLVVNVTYGIPIGLGLWFIGVPNALLWGLLAIVLRFIPYIGPVLAALFPVALSIAVDPGWSMLLWTLALFLVIELLSNNVLEPLLYGARTGLSPIAIIVAAIFWTLLWGPVGLLLSTPLTVCLVVLGRHVPQFAFLDVLLGNDPVLSPAQRFYQRLLALDPEEASEHAEEYLRDHSLEQFYDDVAVPGLALLELDRARGALDYERRAQVVDSMLAVTDNLVDYEEKVENQVAGEPHPDADAATERNAAETRLVCFGARGNLDDTAALILSNLLERRGIEAEAHSWIDLAPANLPLVKTDGVSEACLVYLNDDSLAHARFLIRRMRRQLSVAKIHVIFLASDSVAQPDAADRMKADIVSTTLREALDKIAGARIANPSKLEDRALAAPADQEALAIQPAG